MKRMKQQNHLMKQGTDLGSVRKFRSELPCKTLYKVRIKSFPVASDESAAR